MAFPTNKNSGDLILSQDWNDTIDEIVRLENDKVNRSGDTISGSLNVNGALTVEGNLTSPELIISPTSTATTNNAISLMRGLTFFETFFPFGINPENLCRLSLASFPGPAINEPYRFAIGHFNTIFSGGGPISTFTRNFTSQFSIDESGDAFISNSLGIGTNPTGSDVKLLVSGGRVEVTDGSDVTTNGGGYLVLGRTNGTNIAIDNNEIMARNNNQTSRLLLNPDGGNVLISAFSNSGRVGIGTSNPGNDRLDVRGRAYSSGGWATTNQDFAEFFESVSKTKIAMGTAVVMTKTGKIKAAKKGETPFGVISANPAYIGNSYKEWPKKYLRDKEGKIIMEKYKEEILAPKTVKVKKERPKLVKKKIEEEITTSEVILRRGKYIQKEKTETVIKEVMEAVYEEVDLYNATGRKVIGKHKVKVMESYEEEEVVLDKAGNQVMVGTGKFEEKTRPKINSAFKASKKYIPREERPEWHVVGLLGQLPLKKGQPIAPSWVKIKDLPDKLELWLVK